MMAGVSGVYQTEVTLAANQGPSIIVNIGSGYLVSITIYIEDPSSLPFRVPGAQGNQVQLNFLDWKNGISAKTTVDSDNSVKVVKDYPINIVYATNLFSQPVTLYIEYTVRAYDVCFEKTFEEAITQVAGAVGVTNLPSLPSGSNVIGIVGLASSPFATVNGSQVAQVVPITLTNTQSIPTQYPFQQGLVINSSVYQQYESSNLSNINFQDGNGNILPSWLESGENSSSTSTQYWVLIPGGIPANSSTTIYMCFYQVGVNVFQGNTGAEPNYTRTFGQYDTGPSVFPELYANFASGSLPSAFQVFGSGYSVNAGLTVTNATITSVGKYPTSVYAFESGGYINGNLPSGLQSIGWQATHTWAFGVTGASDYFIFFDGSGTAYNPPVHINTFSIFSVYSGINNSTSIFNINYSAQNTIYQSTDSYASVYLNASGGPALYVAWARLRALPPNGIMPQFSLGQLQAGSKFGSAVTQGTTPWIVDLTEINSQPVKAIPLGQAASTASIPVIQAGLSSPSQFQLSVGTAATQLLNQPCVYAVIKNDDNSAATVYIGNSGVAASNGYPLKAGQSVALYISNTNILYGITSSGTATLEVLSFT